MFTLDQIREAHAKVKSGADFPKFAHDIRELGVTQYNSYVTGVQDEYSSHDEFRLFEPKHNIIHQIMMNHFEERMEKYKLFYHSFCVFNTEAKSKNIDHWSINTEDMICTYYDIDDRVILNGRIPGYNYAKCLKEKCFYREDIDDFLDLQASVNYERCFCGELQEEIITSTEAIVYHGVKIKNRGKPFLWIHLVKCEKCNTYWLRAGEYLINESLHFKKLNEFSVKKILNYNEWPTDFDSYIKLIVRAKEVGITGYDNVNEEGLQYVIGVIMKEKPDIKPELIAQLINLDLESTKILMEQRTKNSINI